MKKQTFGIIVGNRGFFPDQLVKIGREELLNTLKQMGFNYVALSEEDTKFGSVETFKDAKKCAELFRRNADKIDGIIVTLPNFGDEKGILEAIRRSNLNVPTLIHAEPDIPNKMSINTRRDSFCGKISVCNNLKQAGIKFTLTHSHTVPIKSKEFKEEIKNFADICRIVNGLKRLRLGAIGARPAAFNTVRFSEKILERFNISVETIDLFEVISKANKLKDTDEKIKNKIAEIKKYIPTGSAPLDRLATMARFSVIIEDWIKENDISAITIQCWTAIEEFYGIVPCTVMSMLTDSGIPAACEVDVTGALSMYILQLATQRPPAIVDWNNNYGSEPDKCVIFHCSNLPKSLFSSCKMGYHEIIADAVGKDNAYGVVVGRLKPSDITFFRLTSADDEGTIKGYVGEGRLTKDKLNTFGGFGVLEVKNLQTLMQYICEGGFEHHVAIGVGEKSRAISHALETYLNWRIHKHI